ncbi:hypothetical protein BM536_033450 [Streptomyces phaeoluteigriseus]|uniref:Uncharacterized protein n=1 Tax=Streptomyces phaeoluteigriseus TaxID=114686 RepID=A0A1V6MKQ7_9ACTN|nr:DUF5707 domain-containing protein [Streptomyces phaeoluteigriseus]OQD52956.1 hypothetical protein BM536_033450 [Streptomyces phaeoluteigriseus]
MSKRVLVSSIVGVVALGGVAAGGLALASAKTTEELTVEHASARYVAPSAGLTGSLTFTADVGDDSGVRGLKVLAWPASSGLDPTATELRSAEGASCRSTSDTASRCTYTLEITELEAAELAEGTWHISTLATARDGDTEFAPRTSEFTVTR